MEASWDKMRLPRFHSLPGPACRERACPTAGAKQGAQWRNGGNPGSRAQRRGRKENPHADQTDQKKLAPSTTRRAEQAPPTLWQATGLPGQLAPALALPLPTVISTVLPASAGRASSITTTRDATVPGQQQHTAPAPGCIRQLLLGASRESKSRRPQAGATRSPCARGPLHGDSRHRTPRKEDSGRRSRSCAAAHRPAASDHGAHGLLHGTDRFRWHVRVKCILIKIINKAQT